MSNKIATKQENSVARDIGGKRVVGSGCFDIKNDVYNTTWVVETKYTSGKSFSIKKSYWDTIKKEAFSRGRLPALVVRFDSDGESLAVVRYSEFLELDEYLKGENGS